MTVPMRRIQHPGPPANERIRALPCKAVPLRLTLRAGHSFAATVSEAFAQAGFVSGYLRLDGATFAPLNFVTPAPAPGDGHAAWYSATHQIPRARARHAGLHLGVSDSKPFVHCHGIWEGTGALADMGHMLCHDSILAQDCTVAGWGLWGAGLVSRYDSETDFTLFSPEQQDECPKPDAFLITLRPNQDIGTALQSFAQNQGIAEAQVEGIGSLVGSVFSDGRTIDSYATEILILRGRLRKGALTLEIASTGFDGRGHLGQLAQGRNAVCVTAEILLMPL